MDLAISDRAAASYTGPTDWPVTRQLSTSKLSDIKINTLQPISLHPDEYCHKYFSFVCSCRYHYSVTARRPELSSEVVNIFRDLAVVTYSTVMLLLLITLSASIA